MKEIGSFIDLELSYGKEYYNEVKFGKDNILRLNNCRNAIYHAVRCYGVKKVWLPVYECDTVRETLLNHKIVISYYYIDRMFIPQLDRNDEDSAIVIPNYYGIFPKEHFLHIASKYRNVIIDNAQSFFSEPVDGCINVYSARKFNGVPDGAYVIGTNVTRFSGEYSDDYSSDTAAFLLMRKEYGCAGKAYENRKINEDRINSADIKLMSRLTHLILDSLNYDANIMKRRKNFILARLLFDSINKLDIDKLTDGTCVPMVYPLVVEKDGVIEAFHKHGIYQGHWWEYIVDETERDSIENYLSRFIVPITIDQRYGEEEIQFQFKIVMEATEKT